MIGRRGVAGLGLGLLLGGCSSGLVGMGVPSKGRMVDVAASGSAAPAPAPADLSIRDFLRFEHGVLEDNALAAHCRRILDRLLAAWPSARPEVSVWIVPKATFTAEASRDGAIMITTGTFDYLMQQPDLQTEDALAFVIAHEVAHLLLGHARERASTQQAMHQLSGLLFVAANVAGRATGGGADVAKIAQKVLIGNQLGLETLDATLFPGWNRAQELQADALGCDLMARAGYSLQAVPQVISVMEALEAEQARRAGPEPKLVVTTANSVRIQPGELLVRGLNQLRETHPGAADRKAQANAYIEREWGDEAVGFNREGFRRIAGDRAVRGVMSDSAAANRALAELSGDRPRDALRSLTQVDPRGPVNGSAITMLARMMLQNAPAPLEHPRATLPMYKVAIIRTGQDNRPAEALRLLEVAQERFDEPELMVQRIRVLNHMGRKLEAQLLAVRCAASGITGLQEACIAASRT